ncbi:glutathione-regulated potassium-efflux system protein KefC [Delftia sp. WSY_4]|uniref:Kef-type potassium/proton antiporter, CPA2 family n=1 Tax=Delftia lacustris TaxID=558537 RepID=A0A1H3RL43_9BURK|nr:MULTISPECIES: glutathione-regulated potassium-efflux system protein KefC [Delftia]MDH0775590.1 glutathione-regulated potassium-efflux system protein KefC [Delftia tsuruhatensis]MDH1459727.1 glutathione-regulated potassium-efflux system protein KefC [Delftia tsuruhatensis]MDH1827276.1 glutathione-regulated potassium-efflux system protein KefC [Delftia tsuruhatensis]WGG09921.1 glutathione-regulated potassium-efflux system protein KefC [Delftia tsuruhatensis]SDZ26462.1 Kef-type potassium/proto
MEHSAPIWLTYGFLYLTAAVLAVPIARALGLGAIIGYLGAGIAMGPWGLSLVSNVDDILHFAEFGVVLMLFVIGLELQPSRLWELRRPILGWGLAQMLACTGVLFLAAWAFGFSWRVSLIAGMGLALSSTAICLQVMAERNLMRTPSGQAGFSILLFQDVAAIPILALIPILGAVKAANATHTDSHLWLQVLKTVGTIAAVVVGGRLLLRPLLRWIARSRTPEIFTATSLLLVVGIAMLMVQVGLSMALGAFLAGVLLADSEYRSELETNIEPFKGLLLGLFFMAVGMSIDFGVLLRAPWAMAAMVLGFLALKGAVLYTLARVLKLPWRERPVFTLLLAQGGEFAFVVFQTAAQYKVFHHSISSMLVAAVALSMLIGPLVLVLMDKLLLKRFADMKDCQVDGAGQAARAHEISEPQDAQIIIAGFGRYGQIVARVLLTQGVPATILDHSVEMLEVAHTFGYRVFFGDATRMDLLRIAGADKARVLVIAVDSSEQSLKIAARVRKRFPHLEIVARARDMAHWYQLRDLGVHHVEREVFESSLVSARTVLELAGHSPAEARRTTARFREHNLQLIERMYPHHKDQAQLIAVAKQGRQQLVEQMAKERQEAQAQQEKDQAPQETPPPPAP